MSDTLAALATLAALVAPVFLEWLVALVFLEWLAALVFLEWLAALVFLEWLVALDVFVFPAGSRTAQLASTSSTSTSVIMCSRT